ncbi:MULTISPECIES: Ig-like domain-containing protein [Exiguobacterium]|uniref:Ig-like domain-containing protein n=1 Tax=Exiguobacterium TaxID=33986 RepID=UPI001BE8B2D6|nr:MULTISPECIES: Ig-like domain-containing protein [Exiguobacterium]MCT4781725.1 Ig-like domain-containing protein [Exiguobacterium himgiriensis]
MKQPKYLSLFLAGTLVIGGFSPAFVAAEGNTETVEPVEQTETTETVEQPETGETIETPVSTETQEETTPEVAADVTAPNAPVVSAPLHTSTTLTIQGEVGAKAEILIAGKTYERVIRTNGEAVFSMSPQPVGRIIDVRLVDASGNVSETTRVIVAEDASARPAAPVIGKVDNSSRAIEVKGTPGLAVTVTVGGSTFNGTFDANGNYRRVIALQKVGTVLTAQAKKPNGALSVLVKSTVVADTVAPNKARLSQAVTTVSNGIAGTAEPLATVIVTIDGKAYTAPVMSTGKFVLPIPKQPLGKKMSLVVRDGAGNRSAAETLTVQHALFNNFHRVNFDGFRLTLHKEVFATNGWVRYNETFAPLFFDRPSKANMAFLLNYIAEDGEMVDFKRLRIRVGNASFVHTIDPYDVSYDEYDDGSVEETYLFEPDAKMIAFIKQHVRPENRIVITIEGYEYDYEWALLGGEKRAFIQSLQYAGY